jgi:hypothetical protein
VKYRLDWWTVLEAGLIERIINEARINRLEKGEVRKKVDGELHFFGGK